MSRQKDDWFPYPVSVQVPSLSKEDAEILEKSKWDSVEIVAIPSAWRPIDTAPKDGSTILCYFPLEGLAGDWCRVVPVFYDPRYGQQWTFASRAASGFSREYQPTHWMPLPAAPSTPDTLGETKP